MQIIIQIQLEPILGILHTRQAYSWQKKQTYRDIHQKMIPYSKFYH